MKRWIKLYKILTSEETMTTEEQKKAREEGKAAYIRGDGVATCPYPEKSPEGIEWYEGWMNGLSWETDGLERQYLD